MNSSTVWMPGKPPLAQLGDPRGHELVVGARRAEAGLARGELALDLRRKPRQLVQQVLVVGAAARHLVRERGERALDRRDLPRLRPRDGQRQEREHPVRLDLEQPLERPPRLDRGEAAIHDEEAREPVVVDPEVGVGEAVALADLRADRRVGAEARREERGAGRVAGAGTSSACAATIVCPGTPASHPSGSSDAAGSVNGSPSALATMNV